MDHSVTDEKWKWEMGNGKWEMGNGKWEMGKGKGKSCWGFIAFSLFFSDAADWLMMAGRRTEYQKIRGKIK